MADTPQGTPTPASRARTLAGSLPPWAPRAIVLVLGAWWASQAIVSVLGSLRSLLVVVVTSLFVASACEGPVNRMSRRGLRRGLATFLILAGVVVVLISLTALTGALVADQLTHLAAHAPATIHSMVSSLNKQFHLSLHAPSKAQLIAKIKSLHLAHLITSRSRGALGALANVGMVLFLTFYLVADGPRLRRHVCSFWRPESQPEVLRAWEIAIDKAGGYFLSRLLLATLKVVVLSATLITVGVPSWYVLAVWFAVLSEFVPVVGTVLGAALPVAVALSVTPMRGIVVLVVITVFTQLRNIVLAPKLTKRTVDVHPAIAFVSVIASAKVLGPTAAVLAVPAVATVQAFASTYIERHHVADELNPLVAVPEPTKRTKRSPS